MERELDSAYRAFRQSAYRNKYETALVYGDKTFRYGLLLTRAEYAYNTFCQMGVEPGERVVLCLPNCPDLLASFYGLSRLGAIGVLAHPASSGRELLRQMRSCGANRLITTAEIYEEYCRLADPLPPGRLILSRPESDLKGRLKRVYRSGQKKSRKEETLRGYLLETLMEQNRYQVPALPFADPDQVAVVLFGTSCFLQARAVVYTPKELQETTAEFWRRKERVKTVFVEHSFATEGGFLAVHGALCAGKAVLWGAVGEPMERLARQRPDFLVGTEEFFWDFRQKAARFRVRWKNLRGGIQIGKPLTPLMEKFAGKAFLQAGGQGTLSSCPVPLKVQQEPLYFVRDFGVRLADMEAELARLDGVGKCRCVAENGGIRIRVLPDGKDAVKMLGRGLVSCCRREMNRFHLPRSVEFCTQL